MNPPPDPEEEKRSQLGSWLMAVVVCLLLYLLSIGPMWGLAIKGKITFGTPLVWFYKPITWLDNHTVLREPIKRYLELWR